MLSNNVSIVNIHETWHIWPMLSGAGSFVNTWSYTCDRGKELHELFHMLCKFGRSKCHHLKIKKTMFCAVLTTRSECPVLGKKIVIDFALCHQLISGILDLSLVPFVTLSVKSDGLKSVVRQQHHSILVTCYEVWEKFTCRKLDLLC